MGGQYLQIFFASAALILPMLALAIALLALVFVHLMPDNNSTYSVGNTTNIPLGAAYYVNYSATRLTFVSSVSSTLSTVLIVLAMILFSYPLAQSLAKKSDNEDVSRLPSPFQVGLLIDVLDGKIITLWSGLRYIFGPRDKKVGVVPDLWKGWAMLMAFAVLAYDDCSFLCG